MIFVWARDLFEIQRFVRQGCPLSPYFFVLLVEELARQFGKIKAFYKSTLTYITFKKVSFVNNKKIKLLLEKKNGFKNTMNYPSLNETILCKELRKDLAYIKVYGFPDTVNIKRDRKVISSFFENAKHSYENLIIDFRGHSGGNAVYGEQLFVRPFLDKNYIYTQYATVNKEMFDNSIQKYQTLDGFKKSFARVIDFGDIQTINFNEFPDFIKRSNYPNNNYYYFKTTRNITPKNKYNFRGRIFLLIDNNCYSASETIIRIHQQLGLSTIIGVNSGGGEGTVHVPLIYEAPNCHLLFRTEIEMTFNADGTVNELYGTKPDINLEPSTYPSSFPKSFDINALLRDKWIDWMISNEL